MPRYLVAVLLTGLVAWTGPALAQCDPLCTSCSGVFCDSCEPGYWADNSVSPGVCKECSTVANCISALTCTSASDSMCTECQSPGYYLSDGQCFACTAISGCAISPVSCDSATTSQCNSCEPGHYLD